MESSYSVSFVHTDGLRLIEIETFKSLLLHFFHVFSLFCTERSTEALQGSGASSQAPTVAATGSATVQMLSWGVFIRLLLLWVVLTYSGRLEAVGYVVDGIYPLPSALTVDQISERAGRLQDAKSSKCLEELYINYRRWTL